MQYETTPDFIESVSHVRFACPFDFEYDLNPVIHRPFLGYCPTTTLAGYNTVLAPGAQSDGSTGNSDETSQEQEAFTDGSSPSPATLPIYATPELTNSLGGSSSKAKTPQLSPRSASADFSRSSGSSLHGQNQPSTPHLPDIPAFSCGVCPKKFDRRCELKYVRDSALKDFKLIVCSKHISRLHTKRFKCTQQGCTQAPFGFEADLRRHVLAKHNGAELRAIFKCGIDGCNEAFSRKDNMRRHARSKH